MLQVFISWSGTKSQACAEALRDWLPMMLQAVKPFLSSEDIRKGARGGQVLGQQLEKCSVGIMCLTRENLHKDWILFEAGALSKQLAESALFTLLIDLQQSDLKSPLADFQSTVLSKSDIYAMVRSLNTLQSPSLEEKSLERLYDKLWPELEASFARLSEPVQDRKPALSDRELLEEILGLLRSELRDRAIQARLLSLSRPRYLAHDQEAALNSKSSDAEEVLTNTEDKEPVPSALHALRVHLAKEQMAVDRAKEQAAKEFRLLEQQLLDNKRNGGKKQ